MIKHKRHWLTFLKGVKDETGNILHIINFSQEACRKTLGRIIIYDEFSFRIEKGLGFK